MSSDPGIQVKVCCIRDETELRLAHGAGAGYVGLVGPMPSGPGPIPHPDIVRIAAGAPPDLTTVLLTAREDAPGIVDHVEATGVRAVQIVRPVSATVRREVRRALDGILIVQVAHVEGPRSVADAVDAADGADFLLLDSGRPSALTAELRGTGRTHDWALSARIVEQAPVPVFLAGGLRPENVGHAVEAVRPYGVDVCTGLREAGGGLDGEKLNHFMRRLRTR